MSCLGLKRIKTYLHSPVSDSKYNFLRRCVLQHFHYFICAVSCQSFTIHLQQLVTKSQSSKSSRRVMVHKWYKHTLVDSSYTQPKFAIPIFAHCNLTDTLLNLWATNSQIVVSSHWCNHTTCHRYNRLPSTWYYCLTLQQNIDKFEVTLD